MKTKITLIEDRFRLGYYTAQIKVGNTTFETGSVRTFEAWEKDSNFEIDNLKLWEGESTSFTEYYKQKTA